jgi:hypothetical protein
MRLKRAIWLGVLVTLATAPAAISGGANPETPKERVFVRGESASHKQALKGIIGGAGVRREFVSPGKQATS